MRWRQRIDRSTGIMFTLLTAIVNLWSATQVFHLGIAVNVERSVHLHQRNQKHVLNDTTLLCARFSEIKVAEHCNFLDSEW